MKKAFTMIELLVVMVVGAILSAIAVSKIHTSELIDAARSVANDIRYTRILAMDVDLYGDSRINVPPYKDYYYRIQFDDSSYWVFKLPHIKVFAKDYLDANKHMKPEELERLKLRGINIDFKAIASNINDRYIIFNELGEPLDYYQNPSSFKIKLTKGSEYIYICVAEKSGFVSIEKAACK